jgi:hypothetical protein
MAYETIENFLKNPAPELYDFKNESPGPCVEDEMNPIKKLIKYKYDYKASKFDCDRCKLTRIVHEKLWDCNMEGLEFDTMNSFWTTYRKALILHDSLQDSRFWYEQFPIDIGEENYKRLNDSELKQKRFLWLLTDDVFEHYRDVNNNPLMVEFAKLTHSIGNFTMLINPNAKEYPKFNPARGFNSKIMDYWDLSLALMRDKLDNDERFRDYCKTFDLGGYVDENLGVKPLFERKTRPASAEPQTKQEIKEFLTNANERIKCRGKRMVAKLFAIKAEEMATQAHEKQKDRAGVAYVEHLRYVAGLVNSDEEKTVAWLHDSVEDVTYTKTTIEDIAAQFPPAIVAAVAAISKAEGEDYDAYLARVKANPLARAVKLADLSHNMMLDRLPKITAKDYERLEKYKRAHALLSEGIE